MKKIAVCPALKNLPKSRKQRAALFHEELKKLYPAPRCALEYGGDPFRLLVMGRLSAQCKDSRVNEVAEVLFARFPTVGAIAAAPLEELEAICRPCGVFRVKAKNIQDASRILLAEYGGKVPAEREKLMALPGVGEKICNLLLGDVFGDPQIVADTHCIRISNRLCLAETENPSGVVKALEKVIPKEERSDFCHRVVDFGRDVCSAPRANCAACPLFPKGCGSHPEEL